MFTERFFDFYLPPHAHRHVGEFTERIEDLLPLFTPTWLSRVTPSGLFPRSTSIPSSILLFAPSEPREPLPEASRSAGRPDEVLSDLHSAPELFPLRAAHVARGDVAELGSSSAPAVTVSSLGLEIGQSRGERASSLAETTYLELADPISRR